MPERPAIALSGVGKRYTLYKSRLAGACDALGLGWLMPGRSQSPTFWALRNINLSLPRGARIGIVGRNGAGKSSLLKLITGNVDPTEGKIEVNGEVQALLQAGTGMHPEFTGYENIEAALTYQGLSEADIKSAVEDIKDFTELGPFLDQPFKTYSTGMQARLAFAAATVVKPDILIVDEVLGVGDGYFLSKSTERMRKLIDSGATVLLVTHAMDQILRFCDQAIWIDRGQIVRFGDARDVVKAYDTYLHVLDDRRLKADNARRQRSEHPDSPPDTLRLRFRAAPAARLRVGEIMLFAGDLQQERLHVGGPQDASPGNAALVCTGPGNAWSPPECRDGKMFRTLSAAASDADGDVEFALYLFTPSAAHAFDIDYALEGGNAEVQVCRAGNVVSTVHLPAAADWQRARVDVPHDHAAAPPVEEPGAEYLRWPGVGGLRVEKVRMLGAAGTEQASFAFGDPLAIEIRFRAQRTDAYPLRPAVTIFRCADGVRVTNQIGPVEVISLTAGACGVARLDLGRLCLGNGTYMFSVGLYRRLDLLELDAPEWYDLLDRNFEFKVHGREPVFGDVFHHPGQWRIEQAASTPALKSA
jgi:lipopolysaccharide transport system ATP-binding protein